MANREQHAAAAEKSLSHVRSGMEVDVAMVAVEAAKVQATLALAAAVSEIAQNLYRIKRGY